NTPVAKGAPASATLSGRGRLSPFKWGFFGGLGLLLAFIVYNALDTLRGTLIVIAVAGLLANGLDPAVGLLIRRGVRRGFAVLIVMLGVLAFIGGGIYAILPPIVENVASLATDLPKPLTSLQKHQTLAYLRRESR